MCADRGGGWKSAANDGTVRGDGMEAAFGNSTSRCDARSSYPFPVLSNEMLTCLSGWILCGWAFTNLPRTKFLDV